MLDNCLQSSDYCDFFVTTVTGNIIDDKVLTTCR